MTSQIKVGDFIKGSYKFGVVSGIVTKIQKSIVVIKKLNPHYTEYNKTDELVNITKTRIFRVGLEEGESIK